MKKPLPEIVSRAAHPHTANTQILAPFSTSPSPYLGGEVCYAGVAAVTPTPSPGDLVKPKPTTATRADQGELLSKIVCSGQPSSLPKADYPYPTGAHTAMSGTTLGTVEGDVVVASSMVSAQGESTSWSLSPHREKRRPLKPLYSSGATALARASSNPSLALPSSSSSSSSFSHKLRRRLHCPQDKRNARAGGGGQIRSVGASATGPDAAAAAAAAIAAMVSSSSGSDDALMGPTVPGRGVALPEGSSPETQPSSMHDQRGLREGEPSLSSHPTAGPDLSIARSISWSPFCSSSSAAHITGSSRATAAPRLRRGSSLTYFTSQMDAPYRNDSERRPGGGAHSPPPLGKTPAAPSLRRASASPTLSSAIDRVRFPRRSPPLRGTSDADQGGRPGHTESEVYTNLFRSGSGDSDGAPAPLLGVLQPPTIVLKDAGRGGQGKGFVGVRTGVRATAAGGLGVVLSARQTAFQEQGEHGGDSVSGVSEPRHVAAENADAPKIYKKNSHFGGKSNVPQGSSSRRNSRKCSEGHVSDGGRRTRMSNDLGCRRRDLPLGLGETAATEEKISSTVAAAGFEGSHGNKQPPQWDAERDNVSGHNDQAHPFQASWNGNTTKDRQSVDLAISTANKTNDVPEQAAPKSRTCDVLVDPRACRGQGGHDRDREGSESGGIDLPAPSRDTAGTVVASSSPGGSLLVRRNDCILKSLFSGTSHVATGLPGEVPSAGVSFEFGLWKKSEGVPSATAGPRRGVEAALPPPPMEGFPHAGLVAYFPRADVKDGVGAHENRGFSGRISLQAMSTTSTTAPFEEATMTGRRPSPPPSRAYTGLAGVPKLATSRPRKEEWPLDLDGGLGEPRIPHNGLIATRDVSTPASLAEEFKVREGDLDETSDGTTPSPALVLGRGRPPRRRQSPPVLSPRLLPTAARIDTRPRAEASRRHESRSGNGADLGRLRGLKASPPPHSNRSPSALRAGGDPMMWSGEAKEERRRRDAGSSTSSDDSMIPAVSRSHGSGGSRGAAARCGNLQIVSAVRTPPLVSVAEGQHHTARHGGAPNLRHGLKAGPKDGDVCSGGTMKKSSDDAEILYINEDASETAPGSQAWPEETSTDHPERLSVDVSEDLSEESDSGARPRWSKMSAVSESYGEDSQWAADKEFHTCVSRNQRHHILWKRGEQIGMGSFGKVFKGLNESTGELFAVKQIELAHGSKEEMNTLETEIDLMKDLNHRHIVRYCGTDRGLRHLYIFLEYVPGGSIASMLQQFGVFRDDLVRRFVHQILLGMCYLHDKGIIHRDIKGANVLVTEQGIAKLADFGCSKQFQGARTPSFDESLQTMRGSVPWMAPEMVKQTGHGRSADVWSLGATMIEMYTARYPWPAFSNNIAAMYHVATCTEPPACPENVAMDAKRFLSNCLIIQAEKRLKASELLQHPFLHGAAEELLASSGQGPGGLGSSGDVTKRK